MKMLLRADAVVDPANRIDGVPRRSHRRDRVAPSASTCPVYWRPPSSIKSRRASIVCPGFIDMHLHLRDPGGSTGKTVATRHGGRPSPAASSRRSPAMLTRTRSTTMRTSRRYILDKAKERTSGGLSLGVCRALERRAARRHRDLRKPAASPSRTTGILRVPRSFSERRARIRGHVRDAGLEHFDDPSLKGRCRARGVLTRHRLSACADARRR